MTLPETNDDSQTRALRHQLVDDLIAEGTVRSPRVEAALRRVPRHVFAPEATPEDAYDNNTSVVTKRDPHGLALSSVSAPQVIAMMLELLDVRPGHRVLEIGSGGYNAALLSELVGDTGHVTTLDIDPDVTERAERFLPKAGYTNVRVLCADGEFGVPDAEPFDRIIVTVGAADIPPAWVEQLTPDGRLVVPLRLRNLTRAIAFERNGDHLASKGYGVCGFVPMQGAGGQRERLELLAGEEVGLRLDGDMRVDGDALRDALTQPGVEVWSGVTVGPVEPFDDLDLRLMTTTPGFCMLAAEKTAVDAGIVNSSWRVATPAAVDGGSFVYRMRPRQNDDAGTVYEFGARGHGPDAEKLAALFAERMRAWNAGQRATFYAFPAGTSNEELPEAELVLDKPHTRVLISWT